ncbi:MAG TPA: FAD:protein FMN transferase [Ktedonobacterales bacterium]
MTTSDYQTPRGMARARFHAMGTAVTILAPTARLVMAERLTRELFEEWEQTLSRFRPDSELSRFNASAGRYVKLSALLFETLTVALDAARATRGVFDPTLQQRMIQIGYDRSFDTLAAHLPSPPTEQPAATGAWRDIQTDAARRMARLPRGVGLDFGGIGKGLAVDAALDALEDAGCATALVNAGGDLGVRGLPDGEMAWTLTAPGKERDWLIGLERGALATSGVERRHWRQGALERHHLIDPRTGEPAQSGIWCVTAAAAACAQAEVAAKTALILGEGRGVEFIEETRLAALLTREDGGWRAAGAWPQASMRALPASPAQGDRA